jgi:thiamine-monophosphate kinase
MANLGESVVQKSIPAKGRQSPKLVLDAGLAGEEAYAVKTMARGGRGADGGAGERELIRHIRAQAVGGARPGLGLGVVLGIGDDCALLRVRAGEEIAVTTDLSIEGRHFRLDWHEPEAVGHRTLARGLSDLAAMGARPVAAFVSLGLPREMGGTGRDVWVTRFYGGLLKLAAEYETPLAGGDLAESPVALADIVLVGAVPRGKALKRSAARAGDAIYVTGELGGAAAGLERLGSPQKDSSQFAVRSSQKDSSQFTVRSSQPGRRAAAGGSENEELLLRAHLYSQPRVAQGLWLRRRGAATAAIDLSDGLSTDLAHVCEESGLAAEVDEAALPVAAGATLEQALSGGEDYELLFTAAEGTRIPRTIAGVRLTRIGRMVRRRKKNPLVSLLTSSGPQTLEARGWQHFE